MTRLATTADQDLARSAIEKQRAGRSPTVREAAALRRVTDAQSQAIGLTFCRAIPAKFWRRWSGRQTKTINEQSDRYGLPFGGKAVDLTELARALHDFLAENARKLAAGDPEQPNAGPQDRYRSAKADIAEMDRDARRQLLLDAERVRAIFETVGGEIRRACRRLRKRFGPEAEKEIHDALQRARKLLDRGIDHDTSDRR